MNNINWDQIRKEIMKNEDETNESRLQYQVDYVLNNEIDLERTDYGLISYQKRRIFLYYFYILKNKKNKSAEEEQLYLRIMLVLTAAYQHVVDSIFEDLVELDKCFSVGAYKSTLMLAGSILEAFLLDWLSEKDGVDYFEEDYLVKVSRGDGTVDEKRQDNLYTYINQINEIEKPDWMESCEHAHFIRNSRNNVHAKICLKKEIEVNRETCERVIEYLKGIVNTRFEKKQKELSGGLVFRE